MDTNTGNIYQIARKARGLTQEQAAERLFLSVDSIRQYENDGRVPTNDTVTRMAELYENAWLALQHLKQSEPIINDILPSVEARGLLEAVNLMSIAVEDFMEDYGALVRMSVDGKIDELERPQFESIMQKVNKVTQATLALQYVKR